MPVLPNVTSNECWCNPPEKQGKNCLGSQIQFDFERIWKVSVETVEEEKQKGHQNQLKKMGIIIDKEN